MRKEGGVFERDAWAAGGEAGGKADGSAVGAMVGGMGLGRAGQRAGFWASCLSAICSAAPQRAWLYFVYISYPILSAAEREHSPLLTSWKRAATGPGAVGAIRI